MADVSEILFRALNGEDVRDLSKNLDLAQVAELMHRAGEVLDELSEKKSVAQRVWDNLRLTVIPETMDALQLKSANVDGVGRVTLTADAYVACPAAMQDALKGWLTDNGFGDLIKETVNSSTLKAWAVRRYKNGEELPDFVKVTPFTRAAITKVSQA